MRRVAVVVFPGSNCDADALSAATAAGSDAYFVWHRDADLKQADVVILPGGFSYGDYLRSGAIPRFSPVMAAVAAHARAGGSVLGICNGFQILCEAGLLPGALMRNVGLRFLSRPVRIRVEQPATPFTHLYEAGEELVVPVAHGDGRYPKLMNTLGRTQLLILDDWGLAPLSEPQRRDLLELLDDRHGSRSTLVTSQLPVDHFGDAVGGPHREERIGQERDPHFHPVRPQVKRWRDDPFRRLLVLGLLCRLGGPLRFRRGCRFRRRGCRRRSKRGWWRR